MGTAFWDCCDCFCACLWGRPSVDDEAISERTSLTDPTSSRRRASRQGGVTSQRMSLAPNRRAAFRNPLHAAANIRSIFERFDADGSGTIDTQELRTMVDELNLDISEASFWAILDDADPDGTGEVTYESFETAMHNGLGERFRTLKAIFDLFDTDQSGTVSTNEMRRMCAKLNIKVSDEGMEQLIAEADPDGSGDIDFGEFVCVITTADDCGLGLVYRKASALLAEAETGGANWTRNEHPMVAATKVAVAERLARRAFPAAPIPGSVTMVEHDSSPSDASCLERFRDHLVSAAPPTRRHERRASRLLPFHLPPSSSFCRC